MFRTIADDTKCFKEGMTPQIFRGRGTNDRKAIHNSGQLEEYLKTRVEQAVADRKMALA